MRVLLVEDDEPIAESLRLRGDVPIIVISARSDETDRVVGLESA